MRTGAPVRTQGPDEPVHAARPLERRDDARPVSPQLDVPEVLPAEAARRRQPPGLPELAEIDLVRHFTRLSQMNYGIDTGIYPLGSCTMKYNPKIAETVAALPGFQRIHPLQPDETVQGALELLWRLEEAMCEITGMARATLQPPAGACGEMTGLLIMRAFHAEQGERPHEGRDPGLRARHEPRQRGARRLPGGTGAVGRRAVWSTSTRWRSSATRTWRD